MERVHMGRANPFEELVAGLTADEFLLPREAVDERRRRDEVGVDKLTEAAEAYGSEPGCPRCGARRVWRDGSTAAGVPKWRCRCCGRRLTFLKGAVLERWRKLLPVWVPFIRLISHNGPVERTPELCGVTYKVFFKWRHRVLATVSSYRDRIVLHDTVWVDESYINDTDLSKGYGQARKHGLSRQKLLHLRGNRTPRESCRGRLRPRKAKIGVREEGRGRAGWRPGRC